MGRKNKKPWKKSEYSGKRRSNTRKPRKRILIVCEGEKTEPNYFRSFPVDKEVIDMSVYGEGMSTDRLIEEAITLRDNANKQGIPYNQVWCVFDRDSFPIQNFNRAFLLADSNKIKVAYSNEAFEIWYLLHFHFFVDAASRSQYKGRLESLRNHPYKKNSTAMYVELLDRQPKAIRHASKLLDEYPQFNPDKNNPSTTVHLLVQELNKYIS